MTALFDLGRVVATPGALEVLGATGTNPAELLARHVSGDWGHLDGHDRRENARSLKTGARILSAYPVGEERVWIITEADRASTCILLPSEY